MNKLKTKPQIRDCDSNERCPTDDSGLTPPIFGKEEQTGS